MGVKPSESLRIDERLASTLSLYGVDSRVCLLLLRHAAIIRPLFWAWGVAWTASRSVVPGLLRVPQVGRRIVHPLCEGLRAGEAVAVVSEAAHRSVSSEFAQRETMRMHTDAERIIE